MINSEKITDQIFKLVEKAADNSMPSILKKVHAFYDKYTNEYFVWRKEEDGHIAVYCFDTSNLKKSRIEREMLHEVQCYPDAAYSPAEIDDYLESGIDFDGNPVSDNINWVHEQLVARTLAGHELCFFESPKWYIEGDGDTDFPIKYFTDEKSATEAAWNWARAQDPDTIYINAQADEHESEPNTLGIRIYRSSGNDDIVDNDILHLVVVVENDND